MGRDLRPWRVPRKHHDAVWDPSGAVRSPQSQCSGDARADMTLARADMPARNQLKLNSFLALAYQEPSARSSVRPQPRLRRQARHGVGPPLGWPGEQLMVGAQSLLWQPNVARSEVEPVWGTLPMRRINPNGPRAPQCFSRSCKRTWHTRRRSIDNRARRAVLARHAY
jgi:hypothetical protein